MTDSEQNRNPMAEQAYLALGAGGWVDNAWVVKECPLCGEHYTFHFAGLTGMWVCNGCNKNGDFKDLKFVAKDDILLVDRVAELIQPTAPKGLIQVGSYIPPPQGQSISTGFNSLDKKIDGITMSELYIVAGKSGHGKCFGKGTRVVMFDGTLRNVEDVEIGDRLMGVDSKPRTVTALSHGFDEMYEVNQTKGVNYTVNGNHVLCLRHKDANRKGYVEDIEISVNEYLSKNKTWKRMSWGYRGSVEFQEKSVKIDPYFLGTWLGDGTSKTIAITTQDKEVVDYIYDYATSLGQKVNIKAIKGKAKTCQVSGVGKKLKDRLHYSFKTYNLFHNKHIPFCYLTNSRQVRMELLAGIVDADGFVKDNGYDIIQKNKVLAYQIKYLANSLGYRCSISEVQKECCNTGVWGTYYRMNISGNVHELPVRVERRKTYPDKMRIDPMASTIRVKPVGFGEYFGFEVDGDHKFFLEDFTVTHNSTMTGQMALNMINEGARVCFYSGELSAARFQRWMTRQAAGQKYCKPFINQFGAERYAVETHISQLVHSWFMDKLILYDNSVKKSSERSSILERFVQAKKYFDCNVFFVDNLMTAKYTKDTERDYWRQQSNFVSELIDFAHQENVAVILVAHPKKMDTGNFNDNIAGSSEITNKADNIMTIQRLFDEKEIAENGCETVVTVSKDREEGEIAKLGFNFDKSSKRFIPKSGSYTERYGWEDL